VGCGGALSATVGRLLYKCGLRFFPLHTAPVVRRLVYPATTALGMFPRNRATTGEGEPPHATHRGFTACVQSAGSSCNGPFGATYESTDIRKPESSVRDRTFDTSGPRANETMKWGGGRAVLGEVLVATAGTHLCNSLDTNVQGLQLLPDDALRHTPTQVLYQKPHTGPPGT